MVADPSDHRWSSFPAHGDGRSDLLMAPPEWPQRGRDEAHRRAEWRRRVRADPGNAELAAIRQSPRTGRPFGDPAWARPPADRLGLPPTETPRPAPRQPDRVEARPPAPAGPTGS